MTPERQKEIAASFSDKFEEFALDSILSKDELTLFEKGIFSSSMDEKWNVFVLDNYMYWARSWTNHCVFKIQLSRNEDFLILEKGFVTRDRNLYNSDNIEQDKILFLKLLQFYSGRDDLYIDPAFQFDLIKQTLSQYQPIILYKKSIGRQSVKVNKIIYQSLLHFGEDYVTKTGWADFYRKIKDMHDDIEILSLYIHDKQTNKGTTFHFDNECKTLISVILPVEISNR